MRTDQGEQDEDDNAEKGDHGAPVGGEALEGVPPVALAREVGVDMFEIFSVLKGEIVILIVDGVEIRLDISLRRECGNPGLSAAGGFRRGKMKFAHRCLLSYCSSSDGFAGR